MRDNLLDLVEHTFDLGFIDLVKITGTDKGTDIAGLAEDRSVVVDAAFKTPITEFIGTDIPAIPLWSGCAVVI